MAKNLEQRARDLLLRALEQGELQPVKQAINTEMRPVEVARLIEASPPGQRETLWQLLERQHEGEVLQHLGDDIQQQFLSRMELADLLDITASMDDDDSADLLQQLPPATLEGVLAAMSTETRARLERVLPYPEDSAGGLMNTDVVTVRPDISIDACLRYLRLHHSLPDQTDSLMVVNRQGQLLGVLPLTRLLVSAPEQRVRQLMRTDHEAIHADTSDAQVASLFEQLDLVSAPVVDDQGVLLGRITIDDVVDVIREDADHSLMS
ncbi:MAG TPA: CBS domain-containing protein, partial [Motiliproteus sp.]